MIRTPFLLLILSNMKKLILILTLIAPIMASGQTDTTYWNKGGSIGINFNQATLSNWSAGGASSISGGSYFIFIFDYKKEDVIWQNMIDLGYGLIKEKGQTERKTEDKIIYSSKYGRQLGKTDKVYLNVLFDFRTQFTKGYAGDDLTTYISKFMAPGYILSSVGIDYRPNQYFNLSFGPMASKLTFVNDQTLADMGAFGVSPAEMDQNGNPITGTGKKFRGEFGANLTATFNKEIFKNGQLVSNLILFTNYKENPDKIDVNWENTLTMKINDFLAANIYNQLIYDFDIKFDVNDENGDVIRQEDRVQFKNILGLGLTYKFGGSRG